MDQELAQLSLAQREIMDLVWEHKELSARQICELLAAKGRVVAKNTVRTLLDRMEDKGWLRHREQGRAYLYSPTQAKHATAGQKIVEVLEQLCGGSPENLMSALIDYRGISEAELENIRAMLDRAKRDPSTIKKGESDGVD